MDRAITRLILWNVPASFIALMYGLLVLLIAAFVYVGWQWYRHVSLGRAEDRVDQPARRLFRAMRDGVGSAAFARFICCAAVSKPGNKQVCRSGLSMKMWGEPEDGLV